MTTALDLVHATSRHLLSGSREPLNKLSASASSTATTLVLARNTEDISEGSYLSIGLEVVYVWDVVHASRSVTVERAQIGSTAQSHDANTIVTVNPRFPQYAIFEALKQEFRDLSASGLFQMKTKTLTTSASSFVYDLAADDVIDVYDVRYDESGPENRYPRLPFRWMYGAPTSEIPYGPALWIPGTVTSGRKLQVWYKAKLGDLTSLDDNVEVVTGIAPTAVDIAPFGAAARLVGVRETRRVQFEAQPETRRPEEVPVGSTTRAAQTLLAYRQQRLTEELTRLSALWPNLVRTHA